MALRKDANGKDLIIKSFDFKVKEVKQAEDDPTIGIIMGYASTFGNLDRGGDIVAAGAFDRTLKEHMERDNRPVRLYAGHRSEHIIGGIPLATIKVDQIGLFIVAHLDLNVAKAAEFFSLAKKGFISDFSIGYSIRKKIVDEENDVVWTLLDIDLYEISLVNEPMNQLAIVTEIVDGGKSNNSESDNMSHRTFTSENGETVILNEKGDIVSRTPNNTGSKSFDVKDVESLTSNSEIENLLKQAGFSNNASKALIRIVKGFESNGREDQDDDVGREDQQKNQREVDAGFKSVLQSLTDLQSSVQTK